MPGACVFLKGEKSPLVCAGVCSSAVWPGCCCGCGFCAPACCGAACAGFGLTACCCGAGLGCGGGSGGCISLNLRTRSLSGNGVGDCATRFLSEAMSVLGALTCCVSGGWSVNGSSLFVCVTGINTGLLGIHLGANISPRNAR